MRRRIISTALLFSVAALVGGCTYERKGPPEHHLADWGAQPPSKHAVTVCHAYGCQRTTRVVFNSKDVAELRKLMAKIKKNNSAHEERRAVAYAIGWMEKKTGEIVGTKADRPGMDFRASGDPTQQDCVDEATNTTSYLMFLASHKLITQHTVGIPFSKGNLLKGVMQGSPQKYWPHWTAVLHDKTTGQKWAVDSWIYVNGENPAVVKVDDWYIKDINNLPKPTT